TRLRPLPQVPRRGPQDRLPGRPHRLVREPGLANKPPGRAERDRTVRPCPDQPPSSTPSTRRRSNTPLNTDAPAPAPTRDPATQAGLDLLAAARSLATMPGDPLNAE